MNAVQHTPGPWEFRLEAVRTVIFHKGEIGEKALAVGAGHYPDHVANARLIAAAPDLLEGLDPKNVRTAAKLLADAGHGLHAGLLILMADAQDRAIAKARGTEVPNLAATRKGPQL